MGLIAVERPLLQKPRKNVGRKSARADLRRVAATGEGRTCQPHHLFRGTGFHRRILILADACLVGACLQANVGAERAIRLQAYPDEHRELPQEKAPPLPQDLQETVGQLWDNSALWFSCLVRKPFFGGCSTPDA